MGPDCAPITNRQDMWGILASDLIQDGLFLLRRELPIARPFLDRHDDVLDGDRVGLLIQHDLFAADLFVAIRVLGRIERGPLVLIPGRP